MGGGGERRGPVGSSDGVAHARGWSRERGASTPGVVMLEDEETISKTGDDEGRKKIVNGWFLGAKRPGQPRARSRWAAAGL